MGLRALLVSLFLLAHGAGAFAAEYIKSFRVEIALSRNGEVRTSEAITIVAEGDKFKHGIYRDISLKPAFANEPASHFEIESVTRNGVPEPYVVEDVDGDKRIYAGAQDVDLAPGIHDYVITYRTDNRVRPAGANTLYATHLTGSWAFRIETVEARISLPEGTAALATQQHAGTDSSPSAAIDVKTEGRVTTFVVGRALEPGEWFAIKLLLPAGIIASPAPVQ